jgi:hypothetical protein
MKTFDFKKVACILGTHQVRGFQDGTGIEVEYDEDHWQLTTGADGEGCRAKSNNKSGTVTITLQASSESNQFLSNLALSDELSNGGVVPFLLKDNSGFDLHAAEQMYIHKRPKADYGRENAVRVWVLKTDNLNTFFGGN